MATKTHDPAEQEARAIPTPAEFRAGLQELSELATRYAALESKIESKATELEQSDWFMGMSSGYIEAAEAQVKHALDNSVLERRTSELDALDLCQSIQEALDVFDFAIKRDDRKEDDDAS